MVEVKIYVGLNDSESRKQLFDTGKYVSVLKIVCKNYGVPFSFIVQEGGYMHDDGEYTEEKSIVISLIDVKKNLINNIAKDICILFHQESVLITEDHVRSYYVSETL